MVKNNLTTLIFQLFSFVFSIIGTLSVVFKDGIFKPEQILYYTVLSNLLITLMFGFLIYQNIKSMKDKKDYQFVKSDFLFVCVIDILVTLLVYWVMLRPNSIAEDPTYKTMVFSNLSTHLVTPLLAIINFIVFDKLKSIKIKDILKCLIFPLSYFALVTVIGFTGFVYKDTGKNFPYFFIDYNEYGAKVLLYVLAITIFFIILSLVFYFIMKLTYKNKTVETEKDKVLVNN